MEEVKATPAPAATPAPEFLNCCGMAPTKVVFRTLLANSLVTLRCQNTLCGNHGGVQAFAGLDIRKKWNRHRVMV